MFWWNDGKHKTFCTNIRYNLITLLFSGFLLLIRKIWSGGTLTVLATENLLHNSLWKRVNKEHQSGFQTRNTIWFCYYGTQTITNVKTIENIFLFYSACNTKLSYAFIRMYFEFVHVNGIVENWIGKMQKFLMQCLQS